MASRASGGTPRPRERTTTANEKVRAADGALFASASAGGAFGRGGTGASGRAQPPSATTKTKIAATRNRRLLVYCAIRRSRPAAHVADPGAAFRKSTILSARTAVLKRPARAAASVLWSKPVW